MGGVRVPRNRPVDWRAGGRMSAARCVPSSRCGRCDFCATDRGPLDHANATARRWLGESYDLDALHAVLATAAAERLGGDPLWLLIVSGSGAAKTEQVQALAGAG